MKKLFAGYTQYQLLIFLLLKKSNDEVTFVLPKYLESLKERFNNKVKVKIVEKEKPPLRKIITFILYYDYIKNFVKELSISKETILYGDEIVNYILPDTHILYKLEDGTGSYVTKNFENFSTIKQKMYYYIDAIIFFLFFKKKLLRENEKTLKRIDKFYVTEMAPQNLEYEKKVIRINLKKLWDSKSEVEKSEILKIFNVEEIIIEKLKEKNIILFTQPLSEDGVLKENEKINIYKKILKNYDTSKLVIKTHPREKTKYENIFKECLILKSTFPSEILNFIGFNPIKAVTIFSGAVFGVGENVEIDFYGTEVNEKLYNKYGSCDSLMKRNAYFE